MVDWISLSQSSGSGYELVSVTATPNTGGDRTTTITLSGHTASTTIEIEQEEMPYPVLTIDPDYYNFSTSGGTEQFTINTNLNWSITSYPEWVTISRLSGTSGNNLITVTASANTSHTLTGDIVVTGSVVPEVVLTATTSIHQDGVEITVSTESILMPQSGGTYQFYVDSVVPWSSSILTNIDGVISPASGGAGVTLVTLTVQPNTGITFLRDTLTIYGGLNTVNIIVQQFHTASQYNYLTFKIVSDGIIRWRYEDPGNRPKVIYYRINGGNWNMLDGISFSRSSFGVKENDYVEFKGDNNEYPRCNFGHGTAM